MNLEYLLINCAPKNAYLSLDFTLRNMQKKLRKIELYHELKEGLKTLPNADNNIDFVCIDNDYRVGVQVLILM